MEKLSLNFQNINYDEIISDIKKSPLGKEIIKELDLTDDEIKENYELLYNYIKINLSCNNCKNMNNCDHSTKGHRYGLKRDLENELTDYFTICNLYKSYYQKKKNIIFTTFNEEDLLDSNQKTFLRDNYNLLGSDFIEKIVKISKEQKVNGAFIQLKDAKIRLKLIQGIACTLLAKRKMTIVKLSDLLQVIKSEFKVKTEDSTYKDVLESDILVIDGLGNESVTNWSRDEILLSLLDNRLQSEKTTILCSEYSIEELKKIYKLGYSDTLKVEQLINKINELNK